MFETEQDWLDFKLGKYQSKYDCDGTTVRKRGLINRFIRFIFRR